jgi:type IV pilus assembly protein PilO
MRIGPRELLFFLVLAIMPLLAYFWPWQTPVRGIRQWNQQIAEAREDIRSKQKKLDQLEETTTKIENLGQEIERLTRSIKKFEKKLPPEEQLDVVLRKVEQKARKHSLNTERFDPEPKQPRAEYAKKPIAMKISGDFDGFYSFLIDLEKMPRITQIPSMELKKRQSGEDKGQMQAQMVLSIFFETDENQDDAKKASAI